VAYLPADFAVNPTVQVRDLQTGSETAFAVSTPAAPPDSNQSWQPGGLKWSPDGSRLVFSYAIPSCDASGSGLHQVMLLEPATARVIVVSDPAQNLAFVRWEPDGRLRVMDAEKNPIALEPNSLLGTLLAAETSGPNRLMEGQLTLLTFFSKLASPFNLEEDYAAAVELYAGSYVDLARLNADLELEQKVSILSADFSQQDKAVLLQRACMVNGFACLRARRVVSAQVVEPGGGAEERFRYEVEFLNRDGSLFELNGVSVFTYEVVRTPEGDYQVDGLPPR
jgi:hypothetical protein